ncbi:MAG: hypothetical protein Fur002_21040 [Anaerolineales bacterium]
MLNKRLSTPALLALLTMFAYGLLLPFTGFYWDDLPFTWITRFLSPAEFNPAFAPYRPFLGPIFYFTASLIPPVPLYWQIFALVIRFSLGMSAWWAFSQIFEQPKARAAALLLLVFPGYSQHWVAYTHINQELIPFIFYLLSFGFTFKALRSRSRARTLIALLLQLCGVFPTEYFFGIEGIRFLLLYFYAEKKFNQTVKTWLPYLLVWILNAAWLFYYYKFGPYHSYAVTAAQSPNWIYLIAQALDALWKTGIYIWIQILPLALAAPLAPASLLTGGLILVSFIFLAPQVDSDHAPAPRFSALRLMLIGALAILLGRLPSLAAGLPLTLQSSYDRFMVSMMLGGVFFIIGATDLLFQNGSRKRYILAALIALGVGQQFFNGNIFRRDWDKQRDIYWQMAWRIPALKPGTVLLAREMPIDYETDMSFTAPINWMYAPNFQRGDLPYLMLYTEKRIGGPTLPSFEKNTPIKFPYRTVTFRGNTSQAIVIYMPKNGCLRVLDPAREDADIYAKQPDTLTKAIALSDPSNILAETQTPAAPTFFFPQEPPHGWCYYFAKAELAQQQGDYAAAAALGKQAFQSGYAPEDPTEWLLFVQADALSGDVAAARELSDRALHADARMRRGVCIVWTQIAASLPEEGSAALARYQCGQ